MTVVVRTSNSLLIVFKGSGHADISILLTALIPWEGGQCHYFFYGSDRGCGARAEARAPARAKVGDTRIFWSELQPEQEPFYFKGSEVGDAELYQIIPAQHPRRGEWSLKICTLLTFGVFFAPVRSLRSVIVICTTTAWTENETEQHKTGKYVYGLFSILH